MKNVTVEEAMEIDSDEETRRRVREIIRPRLQKLPERYAEELDAFFRIP